VGGEFRKKTRGRKKSPFINKRDSNPQRSSWSRLFDKRLYKVTKRRGESAVAPQIADGGELVHEKRSQNHKGNHYGRGGQGPTYHFTGERCSTQMKGHIIVGNSKTEEKGTCESLEQMGRGHNVCGAC